MQFNDEPLPIGMLSGMNLPDLFKAIGRFVFEYSRLEYTMRLMLARAMSLDEKHHDVVLGALDFLVLTTAVSTTYLPMCSNDQQKRILRQIVKECRAINDTRKILVHGLWLHDGFGASARHIQRSSLKAQDFKKSPAEIETCADEARYLIAKVATVCSTLHDASKSGIVGSKVGGSGSRE